MGFVLSPKTGEGGGFSSSGGFSGGAASSGSGNGSGGGGKVDNPYRFSIGELEELREMLCQNPGKIQPFIFPFRVPPHVFFTYPLTPSRTS